MNNQQLPTACNDSAVVENSTSMTGLQSIKNTELDASNCIDISDKFYDILKDLLLNYGPLLSDHQFKTFATLLVGTFIVNVCKKNIHESQDSSQQSKSDKESSTLRDAINTITRGTSIISQSYSVKNISVNMYRAGVTFDAIAMQELPMVAPMAQACIQNA